MWKICDSRYHGMALVYLGLLLPLLSARDLTKVQQQNHRILLASTSGEDCADLGSDASSNAAEYACYKVKIRCLTSEAVLNLEEPSIEEPFGELERPCARVAETACRTGSRQRVSLERDRVCADLLILGPQDPLPECPSVFDAIDEFNWSVREFCTQEIFEQNPNPSPPPSGEN